MRKTANVRQRPSGTWEVRVYNKATRKHDYYTCRGDRAAAEALYLEKLAELAKGTYRQPKTETLDAYMERWLETHNLRPNTRATYRWSYERHVKDVMGHMRIGAITEEHIEDMARVIMRDGLSASTARGAVAPVLSALRDARIRLHPELPTAVSPEPPALDPEHVSVLLEHYREYPIGPLAVFALFTGLRRSELCGLRWSDIDREHRTVTVLRGRHDKRIEGKQYEGPPKTKRSTRRIALPMIALDALPQPSGEYVFTSSRGPWHPSAVSHAVTAMLQDLGLPGSLHPLRHSQATLLMALGVNPRIVSGRLGHSTVGFTLDVYTRFAPVVDRAAADALDAGLGLKLGSTAEATG